MSSMKPSLLRVTRASSPLKTMRASTGGVSAKAKRRWSSRRAAALSKVSGYSAASSPVFTLSMPARRPGASSMRRPR